MCLTTFNLSGWSKSSQESIIFIFLDLLFGQGAPASLGSFGLLGSNLRRLC
jgi:hypothetical protein